MELQELIEFDEISKSRQRGFAFISQALDCEETGNGLNLAPILYKLGIRELSTGIGLCQDLEYGSNSKVKQLEREMLASLSRAKDRLEFFEQKESNSDVQNFDPLPRTPGNVSNRKFAIHYAPNPSTPRRNIPKISTQFTPPRTFSHNSPKIQNSVSEPASNRTPIFHSAQKNCPNSSGHSASRSVGHLPMSPGNFTRPTLSSILKSRESSSSQTPAVQIRKPPSSTPSMSPNLVSRSSNPTHKIDSGLSDSLASSIVCSKAGITFNDVIGHKKSKEALQEMVILPALRPGQNFYQPLLPHWQS
jgi:hypothetical protein